MKILLMGATGRTGIHIIREALEKGHQVSAIARDPGKLKDFDVEITTGTPYDYETVEKAMNGCDAVISVLNVSRKSDNPWSPLRSPKDLISKSCFNAIQAMEKTGVKRYIALSTIGAGRSWKTSPAILKFIVLISNLRHAFLDHGNQEEILENSSIDYTVCRAPMLNNKTNETGAIATKEGLKPANTVLSRNSAAAYFIEILEQGRHIRETVSLSNIPEK